MKGLVFAGCSHTFGHGLWYYSGLDKIPFGDEYCPIHLSKSSYNKYREAKRFARIVSSHFGTYEVTRLGTAGTNINSLLFLEELFSKEAPGPQIYEYNEIEYIIFQTTFADRDPLIINGKNISCQAKEDKLFIKELNNNGVDSFDTYYKMLTTQLFDKIKSAFVFYESKGIKCRMFCWTNDFMGLIKEDEYIYKRYIALIHNNKTYECALDLIRDDNQHLQIKYDYEILGHSTPDDTHPSETFHKILGKNIIDYLEK